MAYLIISLFVLAGICSLLEHSMQPSLRNRLYLFFFLALVLLAGLREVGIDPDSDNYEEIYRTYYSTSASDKVESTFLIISAFFNIFTNDVHLLFLTYAFIGVGFKMFAIRKVTDLTFLTLATYISFYYFVHEVTQIRTGVLSGLFLLSIYYIGEEKRWIAASLIILGSCFHVSGLVLLPMVFLNNKELTGKSKLIWSSVVPAGYVLYFVGVGVLMMLDIPMVGAKLASYQQAEDTGQYGTGVNVFGPLYLLNVLVYFYLMYFSKTLTGHNKYFALLMKIFAIGIASYAALSFVTVIAIRVSLLIRVVSLLLFPCIAYTIAPRWVGIVVVLLLGVIYMNYGLNYIDFTLLWKL